MKLQFFLYLFLNILLFYFVPSWVNHKKITFFNYTPFVVNCDEGQYISNF